MSDKENKSLSNLIDINKDAVEFYQSAQELALGSRFIDSFNKLESLHSNVVFSLQSIVREKGVKNEIRKANETLSGRASKLWGEAMAKISSDSDRTLVKHLEEAEDRCLNIMQETLEDKEVANETKAKLEPLLGMLASSHGYMKSIKEGF